MNLADRFWTTLRRFKVFAERTQRVAVIKTTSNYVVDHCICWIISSRSLIRLIFLIVTDRMVLLIWSFIVSFSPKVWVFIGTCLSRITKIVFWKEDSFPSIEEALQTRSEKYGVIWNVSIYSFYRRLVIIKSNVCFLLWVGSFTSCTSRNEEKRSMKGEGDLSEWGLKSPSRTNRTFSKHFMRRKSSNWVMTYWTVILFLDDVGGLYTQYFVPGV